MTSSSSEMYGSRMTWIPAVALGALIVGLATWSTLRAIRRGRRKAAKAARNARMSVRESVIGAGRSAADMAQAMRSNAKANVQQMVASPQLMASDAISNFADIPARYRWFRRGMRVGSRVERLRGKMS
jgi:FlaA1/EpsC-like NDP-sugar epimerase